MRMAPLLGGNFRRSIKRNARRLGFAIFSRLLIPRCYGPPISFCVGCMLSLHPLALCNNLTIVLPSSLSLVLALLVRSRSRWVLWVLSGWLLLHGREGFLQPLGHMSFLPSIMGGSQFLPMHTVSSIHIVGWHVGAVSFVFSSVFHAWTWRTFCRGSLACGCVPFDWCNPT